MSKFVIFLLFIAIQCGSRMQACTTPFCLPKNYQTYRVIPTNAWELSDELPDEQLANCLLWQEESSKNISILEIDEVVYQWSLTQLKQLTTSRKTKNRFAQWLVTDGKEVRDYLVIAKEVEYVRQEIIDPWYYPYEGDSVSTILTRLEQDVRARLKGSLHSRYLLQLARLLTTTKQYGEIISLWKTETIREYLLRKMISGYAAGAYYADKQYKKALKMFIENGDIDSMIWCFKALNLPYDKLDIIEQLAETPTNFVLVASHLQDYIRKVEKNLEDGYKDCSKEIERIIQLSHRYVQQVPAKQQAMWLYTEAYAYWLKQEANTTLQIISKAEKQSTTPFLRQSIHTLRLLAEACTKNVDKGYDHWLYTASQWMIEQAEAEKKLRLSYERSQGITAEEVYDAINYKRIYNFSYDYHTDMLRKLVLGYVAPKLMVAGDTIRAIQAVDMADYVLLPDKTKERISSHNNAVFAMIDTLNASVVRQFVERIKAPKDTYDTFYNRHGSGCNRDFWNDIVGTMLLRETRYEEAIPWLEKVSHQYIARMNVLPYFKRNPFALEFVNDAGCRQKSVLIPVRKDYKLWFAKEMIRLKQTYPHETDADKRAMMQLRYAVGMRNSVSSCWTLTQYYQGSYFGDSNEAIGDKIIYDSTAKEYSDMYKRVNRHEKILQAVNGNASSLMQEALSGFQDQEKLASVLWAMGQYKTVATQYTNTRFAKQKRGKCDRWKDYI